MESMRFRWERPHTIPPWCCAHPRSWREYSPYDRGVMANLTAFCAGTRSAMPAWKEDPLSLAEDVEVGVVSPAELHDHDHRHGAHCHGAQGGLHRGLLGPGRDTNSDAE
eukprot:scaffold24592_cov90-Isochrysis_galbana.AAC.1